MWDGQDLEFQLSLVVRDSDQREVLGVKIRAEKEKDRSDIQTLLSCSNIPCIEAKDGFKFHAQFYAKAAKTIKSYFPTVRVLPNHLDQLLRRSEERYSHPCLTDTEVSNLIPAALWSCAKPYQRDGVRFIVEHEGRAKLADGMGVGKSFQAIMFSFLYKHISGPILIVVPTTLMGKWAMEIEQWCRRVDSTFNTTRKQITRLRNEKEVLMFNTKPIDHDDKDHYYLVAYSIIQRLPALQTLVKQKFQMIVADETHAVKNETAKRSMATQALCATAKHVVLLSGTPGVRPLELFTQFSIVCPTAFPESLKWIPPKGFGLALCSKDSSRKRNHLFPFSFVSRWCDPWMETTYGHNKKWNQLGTARVDELHALAREYVFIRRLAEDVLEDDLPPLTRTYLTMDVNDHDAKKIDETMSKMNKAAAEHKDYDRKQCWMEMFNDLPRIKKEFVQTHVRTTVVGGENRMKQHKTIIFAHHIAMLRSIEEELLTVLVPYEPVMSHKKRKRSMGDEKGNGNGSASKKRKTSDGYSVETKGEQEDKQTYIKIEGDTKADIRQLLVNHFQNDENCRVAVLSLTAAGVGLDLFKASLVIMAEMYFTPGALKQAEARAHRLGCKKPVLVEYLIANGTLDQSLQNIVTRKTAVCARLLDGKDESNEEKQNEEDNDTTDLREVAVSTLQDILAKQTKQKC